MSELALPTVVSDTLWPPSSKVEIFDGTFDGCFDVVKCSLTLISGVFLRGSTKTQGTGAFEHRPALPNRTIKKPVSMRRFL